MKKGKDFWLDDPEWEFLRRRAEKRPIPKELKQKVRTPVPKFKAPDADPRAQASKQVTEKEVVLNLKLRMPKLRMPGIRHLLRAYRKQAIIAGSGLVVLALVTGAFKYNALRVAKEEANRPKSAQEQAQAEFAPLLPLENVAKGNGEQAEPEYRYDQEKKVLAYATEYNGVQLTVSQQKLPDNFKSNPAGLISVAQSIKADMTPLETQKGSAFIATDSETHSQTAVFTTDEVLVFVRSDKELDEESWRFYISQLNPDR